jgi:hypothetical protein
MIWSDVKGKVGRQYTVSTSFEDVRGRLGEAFAALRSRTIHNCIRHTEKKVLAMSHYLQALDEAADGTTDDTIDDEDSVDSTSEASSEDE